MKICIAGKNECAINAIKILKKFNIKKRDILVLPNVTDKGKDLWQSSLKRFAIKNKLKIVNLKYLYKIKKLIFFL